MTTRYIVINLQIIINLFYYDIINVINDIVNLKKTLSLM